MQTAISFILWCALITVSNGAIQYHEFHKLPGEAVNMAFSNVKMITGVRSRLHCASFCDQHSSCLTMGWDQNTKTCQQFSRTLTPEVTPTNIYTTDEEMFIGHGYTYISGMLVKLFTNVGSFSWQDAQNYCVSEGGRLVVIDTLEKYHALKAHHALQGLWWVGATMISGTWTLTTGQVMDPNIPVVVDNAQTCLSFYQAILHDSECTWSAYFICEK